MRGEYKMSDKRMIDANGNYTIKAADNTDHTLCFSDGIISVLDECGHVICEFHADDIPVADDVKSARQMPVCVAVANRIINRTNAQNTWRYETRKPKVKLTSKRLQKLLYMCALFWYVDHDYCAMIPEDFVAWSHGPVIPEIYDYFAVYQDGDICPIPSIVYQLNEEETDLINRVVDSTIDIHTEAIIDFTQIGYGPWRYAYDRESPTENKVIKKCNMRHYVRDELCQDELFDFILQNQVCEKEKML
jgi:uncharacterized phage-associated protein